MGKRKKDKKTASGTDTTSSPPAASLRQDTKCLATSGDMDQVTLERDLFLALGSAS